MARVAAGESRPLLADNGSEDAPNNETTPWLTKAVEVVAGFKAGKLPSGAQIDNAVRKAIGIVDDASRGGTRHSAPVKNLARSTKQLLQSILGFGLEKSEDDKLQDIYYRVRTMDLAEHIVVKSPLERDPTKLEATQADLISFFQSILTISRFLITSSVLRLIFLDFFRDSREALSKTAENVGELAAAVEQGARIVEDTVGVKARVSPGAVGVQQVVHEAEDRAHQVDATIKEEKSLMARDIAVRRAQDLILRAHQDERYLKALKTIVDLMRKYSRSSPILGQMSIETTPVLNDLLQDCRIILERMASHQSLEPVIRSFRAVFQDIYALLMGTSDDGDFDDTANITSYLSDLRQYLDHALSDPRFAASLSSKIALEKLYTRAAAFFESSSSKPARDMIEAHTQLLLFINTLITDRTTGALLSSLDEMNRTVQQTRKGGWTYKLVSELLAWALPRTLRVVRSLPLPRVEYRDPSIEVALDNIHLTPIVLPTNGLWGGMREHTYQSPTSGLVPDNVRVQTWNDTVIDTQSGAVSHRTLLGLQMKGVRLKAENVGYYFKYLASSFPFSYEDEGVMGVELGGEGLELDVQLEMNGFWDSDETEGGKQDTRYVPSERNGATYADGLGHSQPQTNQRDVDSPPPLPVFTVHSVHAKLPPVSLSLSKTSHPILNTLLLRPLGQRKARVVLKHVLESHVRTLLERTEHLLADVRRRHTQRRAEYARAGREDDALAAIQISDIIDAISAALPEQDPRVEVRTRGTLKGIVRQTVVRAHAEEGARGPAADGGATLAGSPEHAVGEPGEEVAREENALAVGVQPQLFPDREPGVLARPSTPPGEHVPRPQEVVDGARDYAHRAHDNVEAIPRLEREAAEQVDDGPGWRSSAFDL